MWSQSTIDVPIASVPNRAAWCIIKVNNLTFRAEIIHASGGKFKILKDDQRGSHVGMIIDAGDVVKCEV
jgi:hypothetical protein